MKLPKIMKLTIRSVDKGTAIESEWGELIQCEDCLFYTEPRIAPFPHGKCRGYVQKLVKPTDFCSRAKPYDKELHERLMRVWNMSDAEFMKEYL